MKVPDRNRTGASAAKPKVEPGNANHVGAPMPGVVSTLAVAAGQSVKSGDVLLSIEAMKLVVEGSSEEEAVGQLSIAYGHVPWIGSQTSAMDRAFFEFADYWRKGRRQLVASE